MKKLLVSIFFLFSTNCFATYCGPSAPVAATADAVTTAIALANGAVELNPAGAGGVLLLKGVYFLAANKEQRIKTDPVVSALWSAGAVNNIFIILGAANPVALFAGVVTAVILMVQTCETL